jgi:hypothetical protein
MPLETERRRLPTATGRRTLYLEDLRVQPGDFVTYYARARDIGRGKASTESRSDIYFLEVAPFEEQFAAAQSQAMSASFGGQTVDDLVTSQKNIIVATWKLERRSAAGRSAPDIQAVAQAQGELRARAGRLTATRLAVVGGRQPESPMAKAVAAMGRAEKSLRAGKTAEAIPAEMEALNELLRAQAEIRRREVMRQQAFGAGGGSSRSDQDLSSLFDRELRRQQQTNYETPRSTEERRDDEGKSDALDRVRELARRQEQLARQQEELARDRDRLSEEELRRRLERLAREQSELRRMAEQAAAQQRSPNRSPSQTGQSGDNASSQLREASEEMRRTVSELRRQATDQAKARSQRALERLRELERSMQEEQPDEQRRAMGDLQLETRQLADRQRQLADQAASAGREGDPAGARRRLAGDQERVAERVERLHERMRSAGAGGNRDDESHTGVREAARELEQQRIGSRMRDAARSLRDASEGSPRPDRTASDRRIAETARELARAMDRVAGRLEPSADQRDPEQRRAAEELAKARELREELSDLRKRIAELQQQPSAQPDSQPRASTADGEGESGQSGAQAESLEQLRGQYAQKAREIERLQRDARGLTHGTGTTTPEGQLMTLSAPGTEAFKQDFSRWETLHKEVTIRLEQLEASLSQKLLERAARERLRAGAADAAPEEYQQAVDRYFRSLAEPRRPSP